MNMYLLLSGLTYDSLSESEQAVYLVMSLNSTEILEVSQGTVTTNKLKLMICHFKIKFNFKFR